MLVAQLEMLIGDNSGWANTVLEAKDASQNIVAKPKTWLVLISNIR